MATMNGSVNGVAYNHGYSNGNAFQHPHDRAHSTHVAKHKLAAKDNPYSYEHVEEIAQYLSKETKTFLPKIGIICGSGLGSLADILQEKITFSYSEIPNFPVSTVEGHSGKLVFGKLNGVNVICMQGRFHFYEGYPLWKCCMPVQVMKLLGITHLFATNAAGGLNDNYKVGDIMIIKDHINMLGFAGNNPLIGRNEPRFGKRFPAMNKAYDANMRTAARQIADEMHIGNIVHEGVYSCVGGPNFETVAEVKMLKQLGADAVGMSTVHEVITAVHCGLKVFAFSLITNQCVSDYDSNTEAAHEDNVHTGDTMARTLQEFVKRMVAQV